MWVDSVAPEDGGKAEDLDEAYEEVGYDVLKAVKFINVQDQLSLSAAVEVAKMKGENGKPNSLVDHFDAWMDNGEVKSILLATSYSGSKTRTVEVEMGGTTTSMELLVADPVSGMYTAQQRQGPHRQREHSAGRGRCADHRRPEPDAQ